MDTVLKIVLATLKRLITEKVFQRLLMVGLRLLKESKKNNVTEETCKIVGEELGIPCD